MNIPTGTLLTVSRLSPLHHKYPSLHDPKVLKNHGRLLPEAIKQGHASKTSTGDLVFDKEEDLIDCEWASWTLCPLPADKVERRPVNASTNDVTGLHIRIAFAEGTPYIALLLGSGTIFEDKESYLPLLMTRMPALVHQKFVTYLERTFDCRVGHWVFQPGDVESAFKRWLSHFPENADEEQQIEKHDLIATFAFTSPLIKGRKTFDVAIPYADIATFLETGKGYLKNRQHGWRGPFVTALGVRAREKFAIDKAFDTCVVHKIKYGGLILGRDGKVKFPDGDREEEVQARNQVMEMLVTKARVGMPAEAKYGPYNQT